MAVFYVMLAVLAGTMLPLQAAINATLARMVGSPVWAAAISGLVLTVALGLLGMAMTRALPRTAGIDSLPWWAWTGGLCGAVVLSATTTIAPRLGTASMIALVMFGQVACSLALDHFGRFGLTPQPITGKRFAAGILLLTGAALMR